MATTDAHTKVDASSFTIESNLPAATCSTPKPIPQSSSLNEFQKRFPKANLDLFSCYPLCSGRVGYCVIINEKYFDTDLKTREGTDRDAESLSSTFTKLGFIVDRNDNVTTKQLDDIVKKYAGADNEEVHRESSMFAFVVLSHGEEGIFYTRDGYVELDALFRRFRADDCRGLLGKPKLFFIQACRGNEFDKGVLRSDNEADAEQDLKIPLESDFLIAYSVVPGYFSWLNSHNGSWFGQALSQVLENFVVPYLHPDSGTTAEPQLNNITSTNGSGGTFGHPPPYHLLELLTLVSRIVASSFESHTDSAKTNRMKQMPQISSTLTHLVYFHK